MTIKELDSPLDMSPCKFKAARVQQTGYHWTLMYHLSDSPLTH